MIAFREAKFLALSIAAVGSSGCDKPPFCCPVRSQEEAFEVSKKGLLARHIERIEAIGADATMFDDSKVGDFGQPCKRPPRFHFARLANPHARWGNFQVIWMALLRGNCEGCWENVVISTFVSECGNFTFDTLYRAPNRDMVVERLSDGKARLVNGNYCGPGD